MTSTKIIIGYGGENCEVYDRFTFDCLFRNLLKDGYDHEECKDIIIHHCALSALVMQERICNNYYLKISVDEKMSEDLIELRNEIFNKYFKNGGDIKENHFYGFQLNFKRDVGAVSEDISKCAPKNMDVWRRYYFTNVISMKDIEEHGRKLHAKITELISAEFEDINEDNGIGYTDMKVKNFDGCTTEKQTIYEQLQVLLGVKIEPAPDEWDRLYNVDFFININGKFIGLQIKPASGVSHIPQIYQERAQQAETHKKFTEKYGGKVFYIISIKEGEKKKIHNIEVIEEIKEEIKRLQQIK